MGFQSVKMQIQVDLKMCSKVLQNDSYIYSFKLSELALTLFVSMIGAGKS